MMSSGVANNNGSGSNSSSSSSSSSGPCGACKFLRRKCVKSCIFAPYFDSELGTAHFAAVHKVFGASNASKLLLRIPTHKRLDAVLSLSYEALARLRDPVYGCVSHIFTLQHQVVNLQAELAYVQARISTLQHQTFVPEPQSTSSITTLHSNSNFVSSSDLLSMTNFDPFYLQNSTEMTSPFSPIVINRQAFEDGDLQALAEELVSRCLPEVRFPPS